MQRVELRRGTKQLIPSKYHSLEATSANYMGRIQTYSSVAVMPSSRRPPKANYSGNCYQQELQFHESVVDTTVISNVPRFDGLGLLHTGTNRENRRLHRRGNIAFLLSYIRYRDGTSSKLCLYTGVRDGSSQA